MGELFLTVGEIILNGREIQKKTVEKYYSLIHIYKAPNLENNFIVLLNLDADWSSPDDPARVLAAKGRLNPSTMKKFHKFY